MRKYPSSLIKFRNNFEFFSYKDSGKVNYYTNPDSLGRIFTKKKQCLLWGIAIN